MKKGISLIVLIITIIVMIILSVSILITLSNTGIIERANQAVELTNEKQVQDLASLIWADAYMKGLTDQELVNEVKLRLDEQGITDANWDISISNTNISISSVKNRTPLGSLITPDNYGDTIDYTVTVNGTTYNNWRIYYHNEEYVYLIAGEKVGHYGTFGNVNSLGVSPDELTAAELELYDAFRVGNNAKVDITEPYTYSARGVAYLIRTYSTFANYTDYGDNVVGAIGGPPIELLAAGWNAKGYMPRITPVLSNTKWGYNINGSEFMNDGLYIPKSGYCWTTSPVGNSNTGVLVSGDSAIKHESSYTNTEAYGIYPVVCLKASIPAKVGTRTNFTLIK